MDKQRVLFAFASGDVEALSEALHAIHEFSSNLKNAEPALSLVALVGSASKDELQN